MGLKGESNQTGELTVTWVKGGPESDVTVDLATADVLMTNENEEQKD